MRSLHLLHYRNDGAHRHLSCKNYSVKYKFKEIPNEWLKKCILRKKIKEIEKYSLQIHLMNTDQLNDPTHLAINVKRQKKFGTKN